MADHSHPEASDLNAIEPSVHDQLRCAAFLKGLENATRDEMKQACYLLAEQFFVSQPSQIRYLAKEAARNLVGNGNVLVG